MDEKGPSNHVLRANMTPAETSSLVAALFRCSGDGLGYVSRSFTLLAANQMIAQYTGLPLEAMVGRPVAGLPGWGTVRQACEECLRTRAAANGKLVPSRPEFVGDPLPEREYTVTPVLREDSATGCLVRVPGPDEVGELRESLTQVNRQLEAALAESRSRTMEWQAVFEGLSEAIFTADRDGVVLVANRAGLDLLGMGREEVIGKHVSEIHPGGSPPRPGARPTGGERNPLDIPTGTIDNIRYRFVNRAGREAEILGSCARIETSRGDRYVFIARDVTELRRLERVRHEFMQLVSHELRNPLQVIKGLCQVIRLRVGGSRGLGVVSHLDMLDEQVEGVSRLLEDILLAYRAGTGTLSFKFRPADFLELLADSVMPYVLAGTHEVSIDTGGLNRAVVLCDPDRIAQILTNLLSNATKYTPTGKLIRVRVEPDGQNHVLVAVEDEGIGIPSNELESVFQGFHRGSNLAHVNLTGIGLGLYISREFARRHGGELWAENRPDGGTRMCLRFPLHVGEQEQGGSSPNLTSTGPDEGASP